MKANHIEQAVAAMLLALLPITAFSGRTSYQDDQRAGYENTLDYAVALSAKYEENRSYLESEIAIGLAKTGDTDRALQIARAIKDESDRAAALAGIANDLLDRDNEAKAIEILGFLELTDLKHGVRIPRYATYLLDNIGKPFVRTGQYERIFELAEIGRDDYEIGTALDTAIDGYKFDQNNKVASEKLLRKVIRLAKSMKNGEEGRVIQRVALIYARAGNYERGLEIAESLADGDINFDRDETIQQIALFLANEGQHERAIQLVRDTDAFFREEGLIQIAEILVSQQETNAALELLSDVQKAISYHIKEMFDEGDLPGFEVVRLANIASVYLKAGKKETAVEILNRAAAAAVEVRKMVERQSAIEAVSQAYAEAGLFLASVNLANKSEYDKVNPLARAAVEMIKQGKMQDVTKIVTSIEQLTVKDRAESKAGGLVMIADCYLTKGDRGTALEVLLRAFRLARQAKVNDFQPTTMKSIAVKFAELGEFDASIEVVHEIQPTFYQIDSLIEIGVLQAKSQHVLSLKSRDLLNELIK